MTRFLIDADCAIFAMMARFPALGDRLKRREPGEVSISTISFAEVVLGSRRGRPPLPDTLASFTRAIPMLPFDEAAARIYATLPFRRVSFDRLLAAHALSLGATIITNNEGDFADIPELGTENWTVPLDESGR